MIDQKKSEYKAWFESDKGEWYQGHFWRGKPYSRGITVSKHWRSVWIAYRDTNNTLEGPMTDFHEDGSIEEGQYSNGQKVGKWLVTNSNGVYSLVDYGGDSSSDY